MAIDDSGVSGSVGTEPMPMITQGVPGTHAAPRKKTVIIAKKITDRECPDGVDQFVTPLQTVPLSILTAKTHGPRRTKDGHLIEHSVLGDPEDFEYFESIHGNHRKPEDEVQETKEAEGIQSVESEEEEGEAAAAALEAEDRRRYLNTIHIFERYRALRQERALKNWNRHSVHWAQVERALAKSLKRDPRDLVMARMAEFRMVVEERELLDQAIQLLEKGNVDFWKTNLKIGSDLVGLSMPLPRGGPREVERLQLPMHKPWPPHKSTYRDLRRKQLKSVIAMLDPFYGRHSGDRSRLEVVGHNRKHGKEKHEYIETFPMPTDIGLLEQEYVDRVGRQVERMYDGTGSQNLEDPRTPTSAGGSDRLMAASENKGPGQPPEPVNHAADPPRLVIVSRRLSFEVLMSEVATSALSVYNRGSKTLHFEWHKVTGHQNSWTRRAVGTATGRGIRSSADDGVQRFFFYHKSGTILPHTTFDFPIMFVSRRPGIFKECWQLVTSPTLKDVDQSDMTVTLQGLALEEDTTEGRREEIERDLHRRQAITTSREIIEGILRNVPPVPARDMPTKQDGSQYQTARNKDEEAFMLQNSALGLCYSPALFSRFESLHKEALEYLSAPLTPAISWNGSVMRLRELITQIPDFQIRSGALRKLNSGVLDATFRGEETLENILMVIGYDMLVELADAVAERSEHIRRKLLIPIIRPCTVKFIEPKDEETKPEGESDTAALGIGGAATKGAGEKGGPKGGAGSTPGGPGAGEVKGKVPAGKEPAGGKKAAAAKGGKGAANARKEAEDEAAPVPLPVPKPPMEDRRNWSRERRLAESAYKSEFKAQVRKLLVSTINQMEVLFDEASAGAKSNKPRR